MRASSIGIDSNIETLSQFLYTNGKSSPPMASALTLRRYFTLPLQQGKSSSETFLMITINTKVSNINTPLS